MKDPAFLLRIYISQCRPMPWNCTFYPMQPDRPSPLDRAEFRNSVWRCPCLLPVGSFPGPGPSLYKHFCGEFSRASHLLEFRRHVLVRRDDDAFWRSLHGISGSSERAALGLGVVTLLITRIMGELRSGRADALDHPPPAGSRYGSG